MAKKSTMTPNSRRVFEYLKAAGVGVKFTTKQVQEALGLEKPGSVTGSVRGLVLKGYAEKFTEEVEDENGKTKSVMVFCLTDDGANFDPDAVVEDED